MGNFRAALGGLLLACSLAACTAGSESTPVSAPVQEPSPSPDPTPPPPPPPPATYSVSGQTLADPLLDVDGDLNDGDAAEAPNDLLSEAQEIRADAEVRGFVTQLATGAAGDTFQFGSDIEDVYVADLEIGQSIALTIADFRPETSATLDLDLYLYDQNGDLVSASIAYSAKVETVTVTEAGRYFIVVNAYAGQSNYSLVVSRAPSTTPQSPYQVNLASMAPQQATALTRDARVLSAAIADFREGDDLFLPEARRGAGPAVRSVFVATDRMERPRFGPLSDDFPARVLGVRQSMPDERYRRKLALLAHIKTVNAKAGREVLKAYHYPRLLADPPPDPDLQWNLPAIEWQEALTEVESLLPDAPRPLIAVLDSGVLSAHPKVAPVLADARDFVPSFIDGDGFDAEAEEDVVPDDPNPDECFDFHGTHVATIATAPREGGSIGGRTMVGALPFADLMMIKLGYNRDPDCRYIVGDVAGAIRYAAGLPNSSGEIAPRRADVINMSFGGPEQDPATREAIAEAVAAGVIVVAAAGNEGGESAAPPPSYPAAFADVIAVAATDINTQRAPYSSFYPQVEVAAPGGDGSFDLNGDGLADAIAGGVGRLNGAGDGFEPRYALYQGTSMAAPHVAAGFAMMKAIYPELTSEDAHRLLEDGLLTTDIDAPGRDDNTGFGLISFKKMADAAFQLRDDNLTISADFRLTPVDVDLGNVLETVVVTVTRSGEPAFTIDSVVLSAGDLPDAAIRETEPVDVDPQGFGSYRVGINRDAIEPGEYVTEVRVVTSDAREKIIPLTFRIPERSVLAETAPTRFILEARQDATTFLEVGRTIFPGGGGSQILLQDIEEGDYRIRFSTDMDNDGEVCDPGELGGSYPGGACDAEESFLIDADVTGLDFIIDRLPE